MVLDVQFAMIRRDTRVGRLKFRNGNGLLPI